MNASLPTSPTLLAGLLQRSPEAWERFARLYAPLVYRWGRKAGLQSEDVADITQEVFRVVHAKLERFDPARKPMGAFRSWLFGITRIAILDHGRKMASKEIATGGTDAQLALQQQVAAQQVAAQQVAAQGVDEVEGAETVESFGVDRTVLRQAVKMIRQDYAETTWEAFWQTAVSGRKSSEVAEELGMSRPAVRQAKARVLRRLRDELQGMG